MKGPLISLTWTVAHITINPYMLPIFHFMYHSLVRLNLHYCRFHFPLPPMRIRNKANSDSGSSDGCRLYMLFKRTASFWWLNLVRVHSLYKVLYPEKEDVILLYIEYHSIPSAKKTHTTQMDQVRPTRRTCSGFLA